MNGARADGGCTGDVPALARLLPDPQEGASLPAVHFADATVDRAQLHRGATALGEALRAAGVLAGAPVVTLIPTGPAAVAAMFGVWLARGVHVPVNVRLADPEIARVVGEMRPAVVVGPPEQLARLQGSAPGTGRIELVPPGRSGSDTDPDATGPRWEVRSPRETTTPLHDPDVALVLWTSGTTGRPKAVLLRHDATVAALDTVLARLRGPAAADAPPSGRAPMPNLVPVPLALWAGVYNTLFAFRAGAAVVLLDPFDAHAFAATVRRFELRSTVLAPAMMRALSDADDLADLDPLRYVRSITAPLSPHEARRFHDRFGVTVLNSYGQTELGGEVVGWTAADARQFGAEKLGSVGRAHPGVELRVRGAISAVAPGEVGEIWIRSPFLVAGYAGGDAPDLAARVDPEGFLRTGDLGRVDADGFLWIEGRESDAINRGGLKIFPDEVEEVLRAAPGIADVAVAGVPDARLGEVPWAWLVTADGRALDAAALEQHCRAALAAYKVPARFVAVDRLPRNEVGKVLRRALVAEAGA